MPGQSKAVKKYLAHYAEPEATAALDNITWPKTYRHCLLIPAFKESAALIDHLIATGESCPELLVILIVNRPDNYQHTTCNQQLIERIFQLNPRQRPSSVVPDNQLQLFALSPTSDLLYIDRGHNHLPIPYKQGVGLARKIAADIAAALITQGIINNQWIHSTDADTLIPKDYFSNTAKIDARHYAAVVHPFKHVSANTEAISPAMKVYEQRLHHYVEGLRRAGSAYAYHTLGSCISTSFIHYCQVRGYPKRSGAEDFYLLNKLRKSGEIFQHQMHEMKIMSRVSDRVPFGTGPAVKNLADSADPQREEIFYHPKCFDTLSLWLQMAPRLWNSGIPDSEQSLTEALARYDQHKAAVEVYAVLAAGLYTIGFEQGITHCQTQSKSSATFERHFLDWFDAFKTLKLIHYLRDHAFPNLSATSLQEVSKQ
jgi:hypothetical protein